MTQPTRKPHFLSAVPDRPAPQAPRFTGPGARTGAPPRGVAGTTANEPAPPAPGLTEIRRDAMERLAAAIATLRAHTDRLAEQSRSDSIEIGFQVARKILESELHQNPEAIFSLVRSAVRRAGESRRLAIRVCPDDLALLQSARGQAALDGLGAARIECLADPSLQHGDCVVDADFGRIDGRLTTRLQEIHRAVDAASTEDVG